MFGVCLPSHAQRVCRACGSTTMRLACRVVVLVLVLRRASMLLALALGLTTASFAPGCVVVLES